jgi:serine/threonine protein kinase
MARANAGVPMGEDLYRGLKIGKYEILTQLTSGGMAELFLGYTAGPGGFRKYVVVKRILPDAKDNEQFVKMFLDEARITAAFNHPNIGQVFDLGEDGEGLYLAMEFIAGQNLNKVTGACAKQRAVLPIGLSASVVHDLALALHYAHTFMDPAGKSFPVIHRDVAQKNVMLTYSGVVKLLDFGIAKARGSLGRTNVGTVKGTTGYMSPEPVRGEALAGRSDVFSLGVVLWEMITGRRLFSGDTEIDEMKQILSAPIPRPSELVPVIPETLSDITLRALSRERSDRFPTAKDFARAMQLACPELLFDQDQRATFMAEMFEEKVAATQALLESAGGEMEKSAVLNAVSLLRDDSGASFPEVNAKAPVAKNRKRAAHVAPAKRRPTHGELEAKVAEQAVAIALLTGPEQARVPKTNPEAVAAAPVEPENNTKGNLVLLMIAVLTVLGGFAVYKFIWSVPDPTAGAADFTGSDVPIPVTGPDDPKPILPPPGFGGGPGAPEEAGRPPPGTPAGKTPGTTAETPVVKTPSRATGTMTLAIFPEAAVSRGRTALGKTPLFNVSLPAGTHLLTVVGDDKVKRSLSVQVQAGKNTPLRFQLNDLPPAK